MLKAFSPKQSYNLRINSLLLFSNNIPVIFSLKNEFSVNKSAYARLIYFLSLSDFLRSSWRYNRMLCLRTNERTLGKLKKIPAKGVRSWKIMINQQDFSKG